MAPSQGASPSLPASSGEVENLETYMTVVRKLTSCIITAINEGKSVTAPNKKLINMAAEEIQVATDALTLFVPMGTSDTNSSNSELKNEILACVRDEIADIKKLITTNSKPTYAQTAAAARGASAPSGMSGPRSPPPVSKPALIVSPTVEVKSRQDAVELFKKNISYRTSNYAPVRIQPVSNHKLRVEFDTETQCKDTLSRLQGKNDIKAEPVRKLRPMLILKGISKDVPAAELIQSIRCQNEELAGLIDGCEGENLKLKFQRNNRNPNLYNAVFSAEPKLYNQMINMGRVSVDYQRVHVSHFSQFLQCHKCLQFGHMKNRCTAQESVCSHCASNKHQVSDCPVKDSPNSTKCFNCHSHNSKFSAKTDTKHTANSDSCPILRAMRQRIASRIDYGSI